ncbi:MAG: hypothetical protein R2710_27165 [Acidimicrobiales bacterium]
MSDVLPADWDYVNALPPGHHPYVTNAAVEPGCAPELCHRRHGLVGNLVSGVGQPLRRSDDHGTARNNANLGGADWS